MKKFIRVQSTKNVTVTPGLLNIEMTNPNAHVADRLRVAPVWTEYCIKIREGVGYYPAQIKTWGAVKSLMKQGVLTLGEETDDPQGDEMAEEMAVRLQQAEARNKQTAKKAKADAGELTPDMTEEEVAQIGVLKDN